MSEVEVWKTAVNTISGTTTAGLSLKIANKGGRQVYIYHPSLPYPAVALLKCNSLPVSSSYAVLLSPDSCLQQEWYTSTAVKSTPLLAACLSDQHWLSKGRNNIVGKKAPPDTAVCARSTQKVARSPCTMKKHTPSSSR